MSERLSVDYAWEHPDPAAIKAAGYEGVMRYLSYNTSKNITVGEAAALHRAGLWVGLVWETTAKRATSGFAAGAQDAAEAERQADRLGYPKHCVIFYAVDFDAHPSAITGYFKGVKSKAKRPVGVYGSKRVCESVPDVFVWQTAAWSHGRLSPAAHLYQRVSHSRPIAGSTSGWDENVICKDFPFWKPATHKPVHKPAKRKVKLKPVHNHVTKARAEIYAGANQVSRGIRELWLVDRHRTYVWVMAKAVQAGNKLIRAALKAGPKS
jgi:hypothetical protein